MKKLFIIKTGKTFPLIKEKFGDSDQWIKNSLGSKGGSADIPISTIDVVNNASFPKIEQCAGIVISGSPSMVTDNEEWSLRIENWIPLLIKAKIPILCICYGHQLLAKALGGKVDYHPKGREIGTISIKLFSSCNNDPIFYGLPNSFLVHASHSQTVLNLPEKAICLAANSHDPNHAFRFKECAWGVQFHPEYNDEIMRASIHEQANDLREEKADISYLLSMVKKTPIAAKIPQRFKAFVLERLKQKLVH